MDNTNTPATDTSSTPIAEGDSKVIDQAPVQSTEPSGTQEDSFFDPNTVPEQLKPAYKQMQADYTRKTQEIATKQKEYDTLKAESEKWSKYQSYVPILEEMLKPSQVQQQTRPEIQALEKQLKEQGYSKEAIDLAKSVTEQTLNSVTQTLAQKDQAAQAQTEQTRLTNEITEAAKVDERLKDQSLIYETPDGKLTYGQIVERMVATDPNWTKDVVTATKRAIAVVDALIGKAKTEGKQELSASARQKAQKFPQVSSSPQSAQLESKNYSSMRDAAIDAEKKLGWK